MLRAQFFLSSKFYIGPPLSKEERVDFDLGPVLILFPPVSLWRVKLARSSPDLSLTGQRSNG